MLKLPIAQVIQGLIMAQRATQLANFPRAPSSFNKEKENFQN